MPPTLTDQQADKVASQRKSSKPSVYAPNGTSAVTISNDFEAWLILTPGSIKSKLLDWLNTLLKGEANKDYEDLLKETLDKEAEGLSWLDGGITTDTSAFDTWRDDPGVDEWQDVGEIAWLMQEVQQGMGPNADKEENDLQEHIRAHVAKRHVLSEDSEADRDRRLNAWIGALNAYGDS